MELTDFQRRMLGLPAQIFGGAPSQPIPSQDVNPGTIAAPTADQLQQQDMQEAGMQRLGSVGMLLMAAGQKMTPRERATILAQAPQYMDGVQRDAMTAAQARLMNMQGQAAQNAMARQEELKARAPELAKQLGFDEKAAGYLTPEQLQEIYVKKATQDPRDAQLKDAQIQHYLNSGKTSPTPQLVDLPGGGKGWATPGNTDVLPIGGAGKGTAEEPKKTGEEVKGNQFALQSIDAYKKLADPEYQYALTSRSQQLANNIPYFSSPWSSNDYRSADAASSAMTDAILRNKSGATINDPEIQDEIRRVIPQPGDTQEQLRDKVARQRFIIEGFIGASSPADRKGLRELFDKTNNDLMNKYTRQAPSEDNTSASMPGVKSIRQIQ